MLFERQRIYAGPAGRVRCWQEHMYSYNAESQKQGSNRFNSITKMIHFAHLGMLFIYDVKYENWGFHSFGASQKSE